MLVITEEEFKTKGNSTLFVQFSATWCGPCKALSNTIDQISEDIEHTIYKMDIDNCHELCATLGIRSVPTLIRFENGKEIKRLTGNKSASELIEFTN